MEERRPSSITGTLISAATPSPVSALALGGPGIGGDIGDDKDLAPIESFDEGAVVAEPVDAGDARYLAVGPIALDRDVLPAGFHPAIAGAGMPSVRPKSSAAV